jgi:hypothetical protein
MRKLIVMVSLVGLLAAMLSACNSKPGEVKAVEDYLNALVSADAAALSSVSCADWEEQALLELDSFQAVAPELQDAVCTSAGADGTTMLVACTGKIVMTYNGENQELDLANRTYQVVQENGTWLVCGVR